MQIHQIAPLGFASNCYLLTEDNKNAVAIDPAQPGIEPVARTGLIGKPSMDSDHHFIRFGGVIQRLLLIRKPQQFFLPVTPADIRTQFNERGIDCTVHGIRLFRIAGALDGDRPLVVSVAGGTPGTVLLLHIQTDTAVFINAVVGGRFRGGSGEPVAKPLRRTLSDHAVGRDTVNRVGTLPGMVRA